MLDNMNDQEKPDYSGFFIGTVVFNDDPDHIERVKVTIPNLFQGTASLIPWIGKKKVELFPDSKTGTYGTFGLVPPIGTQVIVSFQNSDPLYGLYEGTPHHFNQRVTEALTNYLHRYGFKDPAGNLFMVDTTPGAVEILVQHVSGTIFRINNNGSLDIIAPTNINLNTSANLNITATGNVTITGATVNVN